MITGVILARNEEHNIVDCIAALRPHVSEILLIDMESRDQTRDLAKPLVNRIISHPLVPYFDAARNLAIPQARYEWLWFVDADERIPQITGQIVNDLIEERGDEFEAINIPFKSHFCGQWMRHCGWWPGYACPRCSSGDTLVSRASWHGGVKLNRRELPIRPIAARGRALRHAGFGALPGKTESLHLD